MHTNRGGQSLKDSSLLSELEIDVKDVTSFLVGEVNIPLVWLVVIDTLILCERKHYRMVLPHPPQTQDTQT